MTQTAIKSKKQKLLILLPLFLIPLGIIIYLMVNLFGDKTDKPLNSGKKDAFNKILPSPNLNKKEKNKLEIYLEAQKDSMKRRDQEASDPNIKRFYDPGPDQGKGIVVLPGSNPLDNQQPGSSNSIDRKSEL